MHPIHHTEALVLGGYAKGEADKQITLYTRDLGLVRSDARGVRKMTSKLRFALQPYMVVQVDLIGTKTIFRVGSTDLILSLGSSNMSVLTVLHRIATLLRRLVPEQEQNEPLYFALIEIMNFISQNQNSNQKNTNEKALDTASLELLSVFRILFYLGYVTDSGEKSILEAPITHELLSQVALRRELLIKEVNNSLRETML